MANDNVFNYEFTLGNTKFSAFCDRTFTESSDLQEVINDKFLNSTKVLHNHYNCELIIFYNGSATIETETNREKLSAPQAVYFPKNFAHLLRFEPNSKYFSIGFTYSEQSSKDKFNKSFEKFDKIFKSGCIILPPNPFYTNVAKIISNNIQSPSTFSFYMISALIQQIIINFYNEAESLLNLSPQRNESVLIANFGFILNQRINDLSSNIKLKDIANELFISERQLSRIIKKQYGVSFTDRKNQLRVESAKHLLAHTNLSIEKISERACFYDTSTFIKKFTESVGISPTKYRSQCQPTPPSEF